VLSWKYSKETAHAPHFASDELFAHADHTAEETKTCVDGNTAVGYVAYFFSETSAIYPITPSSPMGEVVDALASTKKKNLYDMVTTVSEMQSEAGAAGALHGMCTAGTLCSTYTASQGLLLMIPNMYKMAGELLPCVFHVTARSLAGQALCIFGDHSDVMTLKGTGAALFCSGSVQEAADFAVLSHITTLKSSVPFVHFFDGFRTSHEISKISMLSTKELKGLVPWEAIADFKARALNPNQPTVRGTAQSPDIFFQASEAANRWHMAVPAELEEAMKEFGALTGRKYKLFDYYGAPDATDVIVLMGSGASTAQQASAYLNSTGEKTGVIVCRLYSPWSADHFMSALPPTTQRICVLDRLKIPGGAGEPLYLDVASTILQAKTKVTRVLGGRYGLGSKEFTPDSVLAVFENLKAKEPKQRFTVGINDDVTFTSLSIKPSGVTFLPKGTVQCVFWGLGADGTVGANKEAAKIVASATDYHVQAYFDYDAKKSGGRTLSHLRFGPTPFEASYMILDGEADYTACHSQTYAGRYQLLRYAKTGSTFLFNTTWSDAELDRDLPNSLKAEIANKKLKFYAINAYEVAAKAGMGKRVNMILQAAFFKLSGVLDEQKALGLLKDSVKKVYGKKGDKIVKANIAAIDAATAGLRIVKYDAAKWAALKDTPLADTRPTFIKDVVAPMLGMEGDSLPVSKMQPDGFWPLGTTQYEKRGIALQLPDWDPDKCTQCNYCPTVCPHAAIRPFLFTPEELAAAPQGLAALTRKATHTNPEVERMNFKIQVSPYDCTGCTLCAKVCPENALTMKPVEELMDVENKRWEYTSHLPYRGQLFDRATLKGAQMQQPLLEFSGACEGCGETPYVKLLTQLVGHRMIIANATGCSSIWGGSAPATAYCTNSKGQGPAWANSLFEDNAEFGFGIYTAVKTRTATLQKDVEALVKSTDVKVSDELKSLLGRWVDLRKAQSMTDMQIAERMELINPRIQELIAEETKKYPKSELLRDITANKDYFSRITQWIIGGDGWAFDIGYGGLDHVIASGANLHILVLDTEVYSNTGGQMSKATPTGAIAKFAEAAKRTGRKDLGELAMTYGNVYVASICLEANMQQAVKAFVEAQNYTGTSLIIAYCPCIAMGFSLSDSLKHCQMAVGSGYWPLYRFNPDLAKAGHNPFQLDSKKIKTDLHKFLESQNRFAGFMRQDASTAKALEGELDGELHHEIDRLHIHEMEWGISHGQKVEGGADGEGITVLYGSETGNSEECAKAFAANMAARGVSTSLLALDDFEVADLPNVKKLIIFCSTAGQGQFPANAKGFWSALNNHDIGPQFLEKTQYAVFGLGDSRYFCYNVAAKNIDQRLAEIGGFRLMPIGLGDDCHEEGYHGGLEDWKPKVTTLLNVPPMPMTTTKPSLLYSVKLCAPGSVKAPARVPSYGASPVQITQTALQTDRPDRRVTYYQVDLQKNLTYSLGDSLCFHPENPEKKVKEALALFGLTGEEVLEINPTATCKGAAAQLMPEVCSSRQLFSQFLDFFSHPKRAFYANLAAYATNDAEKAELMWLGGIASCPKGGEKEAREQLSKLRQDYCTYIDIFKMFKSAAVTVEDLVSLIPVIKPRAYSIASSPLAAPDKLDLTIGLVDWKRPSTGEYVEGLCTGYLNHLAKVPFDTYGSIRGSGIKLGDDPSVPVVMIALGTGIAPMRAIIQERAALKAQGKQVGEMLLIYGAQHRASDYTWEEDFVGWQKSGLLCCLDTAFSRDQKQKIYVHDRIRENAKWIHELLIKKGGYMVLCGGTRSIPEGVKKALTDACVKAGPMNQADAETAIRNIGLAGKYIVEAWG